jgi:hypothetical protein
MKGIGVYNPFTKKWQDNPIRYAPSGQPIVEGAYDPDLKTGILMDQQSWDRVREAVFEGRPDLKNHQGYRIQVLRSIANSLKWNAAFEKP